MCVLPVDMRTCFFQQLCSRRTVFAFGALGGACVLSSSYASDADNRRSDPKKRTVVIGAGVVGLAVARELSVLGHKVTVLEKDEYICNGASSGNSGIGCTGYDASPGTLERKLLRWSIVRHPALYRSLGLSYDHVRKCGAVVVAWSDNEVGELQNILDDNLEAGDLESRLVDRDELLEMEPSLSKLALGGMVAPREMVTEPWLVPIAYANSAILHGATILTNEQVTNAVFDKETKTWTCSTASGKRVEADTVINCAGLYGDHCEEYRMKAEGVAMDEEARPFDILPRKGQFVVLEKASPECPGPAVSGATGNSDDALPWTVIQPVPTERTKGVIVWQSVYGQIIVGPTAEDQQSRHDRTNDKKTIEYLIDYGCKVLPALEHFKVVGTYSGIRPATQFRDYQIEAYRDLNWVTVGGIRSTGLTAASGIAEYVSYLLGEREFDDSPVLPPYSPIQLQQQKATTPNPPAPSLQDLARNYVKRGDGTVECFGRVWKVTHPLSSFGMEALGKKLTGKT